MAAEPKPLIWRGSSKDDFKTFPPAVQRELGYALFLAQMGDLVREREQLR
jgi:phage-related protein